jgi:hypothetical protein
MIELLRSMVAIACPCTLQAAARWEPPCARGAAVRAGSHRARGEPPCAREAAVQTGRRCARWPSMCALTNCTAGNELRQTGRVSVFGYVPFVCFLPFYYTNWSIFWFVETKQALEIYRNSRARSTLLPVDHCDGRRAVARGSFLWRERERAWNVCPQPAG